MFIVYQSQIVRYYHEKRDANALSPRLSRPTPAKLKKECMAVCDARYHRKDENALTIFFGQSVDRSACLQAIKRCEIDKFRPLVNFLKGLTDMPEEKNVELLAWLIDFEPRPYDFGRRYDSKDEGRARIDSIDKEKPPQKEELEEDAKKVMAKKPVSGKPANHFKIKPVLVGILLLTFISLGIYWVGPVVLTGHESCMYWVEDHYQKVPCGKDHGDTLVIPLDGDKVNRLHKITQPGAITMNSIGHVWYVKVNGTIEFYTSDGFYPLDLRLRLKPITRYIIEKYVHPVQAEVQASK